jgi:hypothetical protein
MEERSSEIREKLSRITVAPHAGYGRATAVAQFYPAAKRAFEWSHFLPENR